MPAPGSPVASMITSMSGCAISAMASSVTSVLPLLSASSSDVASILLGRPAGRHELASRARGGIRSATPTTCMPSRQPHLRQEHGAELAGADLPDRDRPARGLPLKQHGVQIHEARPPSFCGKMTDRGAITMPIGKPPSRRRICRYLEVSRRAVLQPDRRRTSARRRDVDAAALRKALRRVVGQKAGHQDRDTALEPLAEPAAACAGKTSRAAPCACWWRRTSPPAASMWTASRTS